MRSVLANWAFDKPLLPNRELTIQPGDMSGSTLAKRAKDLGLYQAAITLYSSEDEADARALQELLEGLGLRVFVQRSGESSSKHQLDILLTPGVQAYWSLPAPARGRAQ